MKNTVFTQHPRLEKYYQTADGINFFIESDAQAHAGNLKNRVVKVMLKNEAPTSPLVEDAANVNENEASASPLVEDAANENNINESQKLNFKNKK